MDGRADQYTLMYHHFLYNINKCQSREGQLEDDSARGLAYHDENGDGFLQKEEVVRAIEMMVDYGVR